MMMVTIADEFLKSFKLIGCLLYAYCEILTFIIKKFQNVIPLTFEFCMIVNAHIRFTIREEIHKE